MIVKYNIQKALTLLVSAVFLFSCGEKSTTDRTLDTDNYFDTQSFFREELRILKAENPTVNKTIQKEDEKETKNVIIKNWDNELSSFTSIDLTKESYTAQFDVDSIENIISYKAKNSNLDIRSVELLLDTNKNLQKISIVKETDNTLYRTIEKLTYIKNSGYKVEKEQKVLLLGTNKYLIEGAFFHR